MHQLLRTSALLSSARAAPPYSQDRDRLFSIAEATAGAAAIKLQVCRDALEQDRALFRRQRRGPRP